MKLIIYLSFFILSIASYGQDNVRNFYENSNVKYVSDFNKKLHFNYDRSLYVEGYIIKLRTYGSDMNPCLMELFFVPKSSLKRADSIIGFFRKNTISFVRTEFMIQAPVIHLDRNYNNNPEHTFPTRLANEYTREYSKIVSNVIPNDSMFYKVSDGLLKEFISVYQVKAYVDIYTSDYYTYKLINPITQLDSTDFKSTETIAFYQCRSVTSVKKVTLDTIFNNSELYKQSNIGGCSTTVY